MELSERYIQWVKKSRKAKKLHTYVEERLIQILSVILPDHHAIKEPQGLAGGRNDLMLFEFNGRKVLFEVFASKTQVSRDLRILDKTRADVKIAVIIDKEVDSSVFEKFIKENPEDNYPYLFTGELFEQSLARTCALKLYELIKGDEEAKFQRILMQRLSRKNFIEGCQKAGIEILSETDIATGDVTFQKVFVTIILGKLSKFGIQRGKLKDIGRWLSDSKVLEFTLLKVSLGFNVFLYTNFKDTFAIDSDGELLDWIRIGHEFSEPYTFLSMNAIIHEIFDKHFKPKEGIEFNRDIKYTVGYSQIIEEENGRIVTFSIPKDTSQILVFRPMLLYKKGEEKPKELTKEEYLEMMIVH